MSAQAPNAKELKKEMKGLSKVKVKESSGGPSKEDRKPLEDIYKSHKGDFKKIKADSKFKGCAWRVGFEPKDAKHFATSVLTGLAFDE
mmetsp:Transcript_7439/g.12938  ORF Transcript_7439/g.12938 Transcript_7439/m.12938 type:complete len:88 (+) Transcript_7439:162-425(+)|eukprot:CAMPEP_0184540326 /NCGR_PEP_ID=MMETSP0199_2-20130426/154_1 /TAXON_ID=1112570 /ORGANISM="Thraustochytrium sp., Strain LLF1b" /LENGTH=87 /DNA_ID=CAMNT_0026933889 /DNA_START=79 /DNA_END=342 /DNA_ORIENTATION=+